MSKKDPDQDGIIQKAKKLIKSVTSLLEREIWSRGALEETGRRARSFALLRILTIVSRGINGNKLFSQAAALSYYSLIGLGPLLAIGIMISSFLLQGDDRDNVIVDKLGQALVFVAPPVSEWDQEDSDPPAVEKSEVDAIDPDEEAEPKSTARKAEEATEALNPAVVQFIDQIVKSARSGAVGVIGSIALIVIVIQLITSIEKAFNGIWGVRRGRSWAQRIISYWTITSLGAVLSITAVTVLSASTVINRFNQLIPGLEYEDINWWAGPIISFTLLTLVLAVFNRFFPHTSVHWKASLVGGFIGAFLMVLNHSLSFLYVHKVIRDQSLYGSVGIIPVLMFGLYLFWLIVLVSCEVTYAVQNVDNLTNETAWSDISPQTRESLALACFLFIARRFNNCESPPTTTEIANHLRAPGQLMNNCLTRLSVGGWIRGLEPDETDSQEEIRFQPSFPLENRSMEDFHNAFISDGNNQGAEILTEVEPAIGKFQKGLLVEDSLKMPFSELLRKKPKA
ncbi:YihY/virulence factor BrkB family protein [Puniceicoccus vermicola]|uniref:YihY/virulence factor BrkB family protein n=1 Tax=Puniceicoccus vermicola TaxID=388746 RepID=A0A7X1AXT7_9BACT|nr:YihY/virulence factor BrkB family protein [Puniceicoccus vermicola]MBC2601936.1 YihY/virulence factor BrkB family protein [Puniceicoccus vermicola]